MYLPMINSYAGYRQMPERQIGNSYSYNRYPRSFVQPMHYNPMLNNYAPPMNYRPIRYLGRLNLVLRHFQGWGGPSRSVIEA